MGKKYFFDQKNLVFKEEPKTLRNLLIRLRNPFYFAIGIAILFCGLSYFGIFTSPEKLYLQERGKHLITKINTINSAFDSISEFLSHAQKRDDNFYRVITQKDPIDPTARQAGFGGINNYEDLEGYDNSNLLIDAKKRGDILLSQLNIQRQSYDTLIEYAKVLNDSLLSVPAIQPMAPNDYKMITSPFGWRMHPILHQYIHHDGVDFAAEIGRKIYATGYGVVIATDENASGYGRRVIIDHGFGYHTLYGHMSKILVHIGDTVYRGSLIGKVGNTGSSTGPHVHYEVIYKFDKKDPANYYTNDLSQKEYKEIVKSFSKAN
jgi:murein DD-endopeptidase MepM/ murein hydrolase activator NlpD